MDDSIEQAYRRFRKHLDQFGLLHKWFDDINTDGLTRAGGKLS